MLQPLDINLIVSFSKQKATCQIKLFYLNEKTVRLHFRAFAVYLYSLPAPLIDFKCFKTLLRSIESRIFATHTPSWVGVCYNWQLLAGGPTWSSTWRPT